MVGKYSGGRNLWPVSGFDEFAGELEREKREKKKCVCVFELVK